MNIELFKRIFELMYKSRNNKYVIESIKPLYDETQKELSNIIMQKDFDIKKRNKQIRRSFEKYIKNASLSLAKFEKVNDSHLIIAKFDELNIGKNENIDVVNNRINRAFLEVLIYEFITMSQEITEINMEKDRMIEFLSSKISIDKMKNVIHNFNEAYNFTINGYKHLFLLVGSEERVNSLASTSEQIKMTWKIFNDLYKQLIEELKNNLNIEFEKYFTNIVETNLIEEKNIDKKEK